MHLWLRKSMNDSKSFVKIFPDRIKKEFVRVLSSKLGAAKSKTKT